MIRDTTADDSTGSAAGGAPVPRGVLGLVNRVPLSRVLAGLMMLQIALAGLMILPDANLERLMGRERAVETTVYEPIRPGDQTRPYSPRVLPRRANDDDSARPALPAGTADALEFRHGEHRDLGLTLELLGSIGVGDSDRFERMLDALPTHVNTIMLNSPGGVVQEALRIGRMLHERGMHTAVSGDNACMSACPLILFAGVERHVSERAWVGMHQAYLPANTIMPTAAALTSIQSLQGEVLLYTEAMGVDPMVHVHALATPPDDAYFLVEEELLLYRVVTRMFDFEG